MGCLVVLLEGRSDEVVWNCVFSVNVADGEEAEVVRRRTAVRGETGNSAKGKARGEGGWQCRSGRR